GARGSAPAAPATHWKQKSCGRVATRPCRIVSRHRSRTFPWSRRQLHMTSKRIQAAVLSVTLLLPAGTAFGATRYHHRHHYSQARGAAIGAVAGALLSHGQPLKGAIIGGAVGEGVQALRNHQENIKHRHRYHHRRY